MIQIFKMLVFLLALSLLSGCYPVDTDVFFDNKMSHGESYSKPIYLTFRDNKNASFYFLLNKDSAQPYYRLIVRWKNPSRSDLLFDGERTRLQFIVDRQNIYTFYPVQKTKVVTYYMNSSGQEEEGIFEIPHDIFEEITYAKYISVHLRGKYQTVIGEFNRFNTKKAFRDFYENSY